jgi:hypothetical protein
MSFRGFIRETIEVSQAELNEIAQEVGSIRVGATEHNPNKRANQYEDEGYSGVMYYSKTTNMQLAENKLLEHNTRHNKHKRSNIGDGPGYVYVIVGKKFS